MIKLISNAIRRITNIANIKKVEAFSLEQFKRICIVTLVVFSLLLCAIFVDQLFIWHAIHREAKRPYIVSLDIKKIFSTFVLTASKATLNNDERTQLTKRFIQDFTYRTSEYARNHGVVIVTHGAIIGGAPDITPIIEKEINDNLGFVESDKRS